MVIRIKAFLVLVCLFIFGGCNKGEVGLAQVPTNIDIASNTSIQGNANKEKPQSYSDKIIAAQKSPPRTVPKWTPGNFKGLQLGKSTEKDVRRIFGKPKYILNPEDEYDNPIESRLDYVYENEPQIIIDKKSKIVIEIWGGDFSTFEEAVEKYGNDFYEVEFKKKGCVFKDFKGEKKANDYPVYFAYPKHGFYFALNAKNDVVVIYQVAKCGE